MLTILLINLKVALLAASCAGKSSNRVLTDLESHTMSGKFIGVLGK